MSRFDQAEVFQSPGRFGDCFLVGEKAEGVFYDLVPATAHPKGVVDAVGRILSIFGSPLVHPATKLVFTPLVIGPVLQDRQKRSRLGVLAQKLHEALAKWDYKVVGRRIENGFVHQGLAICSLA
jgi:hypothetical protein